MHYKKITAIITALAILLSSCPRVYALSPEEKYQTSLLPGEQAFSPVEDKADINTESDTEEIIIPREKILLSPVEEGYTHEEHDSNLYDIGWSDKSITHDEFKLICITVACEGGCLPKYSKRLTLIAKAILNRYCSDLFPDTVKGVIYQKYNGKAQFSVTKWEGFPNAYKDRVTPAVEEAVYMALATDNVPYDMFYFCNDSYFSWADNYDNDGVMYFSRQKGDKT